jgi:uncharacterized protein YpmS
MNSIYSAKLVRGKMKNRNFALIFAAIILVMAVLACTINIGGPDYPAPAIPVSTEAVGEMQSFMETSVAAGESSGQIVLTFTESQLTSYLNSRLLAQPNPLVTNPQVYLRDGQIMMYATFKKNIFTATARIILNAGVDEQGKLKIELVSADFGPLSTPNGLKEIISSAIQEAYTGALGPVATGFRIQSVTIADGTMTIVGQIK